MALNVLEGFNVGAMEYGSAAYYHLLIETMKQVFADRNHYIADPAHVAIPVTGLLSKAYATARRRDITLDHASDYVHGNPAAFGNTVYVTLVEIVSAMSFP